MPIDFHNSTRGARGTQLEFLLTEASTGLMFASLVESEKDEGRNARNVARARLAYDSVVRFIDRVSMTREERQEVLAALGSLKERLKTLGEKF